MWFPFFIKGLGKRWLADSSTFIEGVCTQMHDLDALFTVNWESWRNRWFRGCLLKCVWSLLQIRRPTRPVVRMRTKGPTKAQPTLHATERVVMS